MSGPNQPTKPSWKHFRHLDRAKLVPLQIKSDPKSPKITVTVTLPSARHTYLADLNMIRNEPDFPVTENFRSTRGAPLEPANISSSYRGTHGHTFTLNTPRSPARYLVNGLIAYSTFAFISASIRTYADGGGEREGLQFANGPRSDANVHRGGKATKQSMPPRRHPSG